jgi:hypothetical protein
MFLQGWWAMELFRLAFVAFIGSMGLKMGPKEPSPRLARVAVILDGAAAVFLSDVYFVSSLVMFIIFGALLIGGFLAFLLSLGYEPESNL